MGALLGDPNELLRVVRCLHEMGATRVRLSPCAGLDVSFLGPGSTQDEKEESAEQEAQRRKREEEDDLFRSAG